MSRFSAPPMTVAAPPLEIVLSAPPAPGPTPVWPPHREYHPFYCAEEIRFPSPTLPAADNDQKEGGSNAL